MNSFPTYAAAAARHAELRVGKMMRIEEQTDGTYELRLNVRQPTAEEIDADARRELQWEARFS